ncbi:MAG TPA: transposase, partial [Pseudoclavibacter sp.]|nr:transposase [Pseudoclavibacter sp.]
AATAGVSRSWIYTQPDLLERIHTLSNGRTSDSSGPAAQRASVASLQRRLELAHDRVRQLTAENEQLRDELAHAYGRLRRPT